MTAPVPQQVLDVLARAGVGSRRLRTALDLLAGDRWWSIDALVRATATSRRAIDELLSAAEVEERGAGEVRIRPDRAAAYRALTAEIDAFTVADPVAHLLPAHANVVAEMDKLIAAAPRSRRALDHVAATAETVVRRALLLGARFWLDGAKVLCVGDHDLTALAIAATHPGVDVTVVDVDDRILEWIDTEAARRSLPVRCRFADLRLGLPPGAQEWADLAVTDPPYTPEGVGLFCLRALEGLRDRGEGRLLLAYGASEATPTLVAKVQAAIGRLHLAYEAIWPDFNHYQGAPAIGSASDLYVLRPTSRSWTSTTPRTAGTNIYTQGPQSVEAAAGDGMDLATAQSVLDLTLPGGADLLVGEWPRGFALRTPRAQLATWLAKPYAARLETVAIALPSGMSALLPRVLLAARAQRVGLVIAGPVPSAGELSALLAPAYRVTVTDDSPRGGLSTLVAERAEPAVGPAAVLRYILDRAHGKVANAWREGLVAYARDHGTVLTKNAARAAVAAADPGVGDSTLLELPRHLLSRLPKAVRSSATDLA